MAKILVIEDHQIFQSVYQEVLERRDLEVLSAYDGQTGLKLAKEHRPDLILLDLMLPGVNGLEFLKAFKANQHPETKIIVLSNVDLEAQKRTALELGATRYLIKAEYFTPKQLLATIDELLPPAKS